MVPDDSGGMLTVLQADTPQFTAVGSIVRTDGSTGNVAWRYDGGGIDPGVTAQDGMVYSIELLPVGINSIGTVNYHSYLTQLDEQTGAVVQRYELPFGSVTLPDGNGGSFTYENGALPGPISAMPDGSIVVGLDTLIESETSTPTDALYSMTVALYIARLDTSGGFTVTQLRTASGTRANSWPDIVEPIAEGVIPDGQGGMLLTWTGAAFNDNSLHVMHTDAGGSELADYPLAIPAANNNGDQLVLGENGTVVRLESAACRSLRCEQRQHHLQRSPRHKPHPMEAGACPMGWRYRGRRS
jgi:hypothetical protein